jgi:polyprenyl P-hydroxybenzoate/phenylacrylic acid decarboxylase-like protein
MKKRLAIGISGASCACLAVKLLEAMQQQEDWETHLVISGGARRTIVHETNVTVDYVESLATRAYPIHDVGANLASGTFKVEGMVIVPCAMKTLAGVVQGYSDNLLLRAADVNIKEKRKLVMVTRETPLSPIHLRNMCELVNMGVTIMPPMLTYYNMPQTLDDMNTHIVGKILSEFGIELRKFRRWETNEDQRAPEVGAIQLKSVQVS